MRELQPGRARAAHRRAGARRRARGRHRRCCRKTPPLNQRLESLLQELQTFAEDPLVPRGIQRDRPRRVERAATRRCDYLAPAQTHVQLRDAVVPQHLLAAERGRPQRHLAAVHHRHHAAGPEQRGRPVLGARPTGRRVDNHLHTNPYPNTAAPGQPKECEAGNEPYLRGQDGASATCPARSRRDRRRATP